MDLATKYFNQINWRYVDHSSGLEPMQSFAFDDTFSESVGKDLSCNVVRTWIHQHTVILGIHDSRLPFLVMVFVFLQMNRDIMRLLGILVAWVSY